MNRLIKSSKAIFVALACTVLLGVAPRAHAASILLYDHLASTNNAGQALTGLGLAYTSSNPSDFNTLLASQAWDLVLMDVPSTLPAGGFGGLVDYINGGGAAIMSFWTLQTEAALAAAFGVSVAASFNTPRDVFPWDAGHPIFNGVGALNSWSDHWADDGDALDSAGATFLGGFTAAPTAGEGAIALHNGGRTIYNGFLFDEMLGPAGIRLIQNEIQFVLDASPQPVPEPGTMALVASGLALALRRRRRK